MIWAQIWATQSRFRMWKNKRRFQNGLKWIRLFWSLWTSTQSLELRSAYLFLEILFYISYFLLKRSAFSLKLDVGDFPTIANIRINTSQSLRVDWKAYTVFMLLRAVIKRHWADRSSLIYVFSTVMKLSLEEIASEFSYKSNYSCKAYVVCVFVTYLLIFW